MAYQISTFKTLLVILRELGVWDSDGDGGVKLNATFPCVIYVLQDQLLGCLFWPTSQMVYYLFLVFSPLKLQDMV